MSKQDQIKRRRVVVRIAVALLGIVVIATALTCLGLKFFLGFRFEWGNSKVQMQTERNSEIPLAVVRVVDPESSQKAIADSVGIHAFNEIYASIGVTRHGFERWESQYGIDSLGRSASGAVLAPGYPVFSKVAWMYVDPVTLTSAETSALVEECERAIPNSVSESAKQELEGIKALAKRALSNSAVIRFDHP